MEHILEEEEVDKSINYVRECAEESEEGGDKVSSSSSQNPNEPPDIT